MNIEPTRLKQIKKILKLDGHHNFGDIFRKVSELVESNETLLSERKALETLLSANTDFRAGIFDTVTYILNERDEAVSQLSEITKMLVESSMMRRNINSSVKALIEIATAPDATQPQLSEIRYVLHGDIQPCSVLYSDDTTTLLRLDEGDMMLETDTIEWSDSVTYRCQELLRGFVGLTASAKFTYHTMHAASAVMAQLVRDERILLNDDALETVSDAVPCPPAPAPESTCGNPYVHTSSLSEEKLRDFGWTTEGLVQNGYGHYNPFPAEWTSNNPSTQLRSKLTPPTRS